MKRLFLLSLFAILFSVAGTYAGDIYRVIDIRGSVKFKGEALRNGSTLSGSDVLYSSIKSLIKVTDGKTSYTLQLYGKKTVGELISSVPDVYEVAIKNLRKQKDSGSGRNTEYSMVTMALEEMPIDLHENEAAALCKEDSLGNLKVTFMRFGMEKPLTYSIDMAGYNYLLRLDIITAKGNDHAYSSLDVFDILWKPMMKYLKEGDIFIYTIPLFLSDIDMTLIPVSSRNRMGQVLDMISIDSF